MNRSKQCIWPILLFLITLNCGDSVTDLKESLESVTDQDTQDQGDTPIPSSVPPSAALQLLDTLCGKLTECFTTLSLEACESGILSSANLDEEIGLTQNQYNSYQEIIEAEESGELIADLDTFSSCQESIKSITCTDTEVQIAADQDIFSQSAGLLSLTEGSCEDVFLKKEKENLCTNSNGSCGCF